VKTQWKGCGTALVTPFDDKGRIDFGTLERLVEWQVAQGIDFLVPCGTTGESATMSGDERKAVTAFVVKTVKARVPVLAGAGGNHTAKAVFWSRDAEAAGADGILSVTPMYNKPSPEGLVRHFSAIADATRLPIVVYNVPSRTGTNVDAATFLRLADHPRVIGIKEASGNLEQIAGICAERPHDVAVLAGDDAWTLPILALGGDGVVSVASNEIPGELVALCAAAGAGDWDAARRVHERWLPLFLANFHGAPNPVPVKAALAAMGLLDGDTVRAPLLTLEPQPRAALVGLLQRLGIVEVAGGRILGTVDQAAVA
jgi:4-hydroxy-tetrahydrodipicolinate synthase